MLCTASMRHGERSNDSLDCNVLIQSEYIVLFAFAYLNLKALCLACSHRELNENAIITKYTDCIGATCSYNNAAVQCCHRIGKSSSNDRTLMIQIVVFRRVR